MLHILLLSFLNFWITFKDIWVGGTSLLAWPPGLTCGLFPFLSAPRDTNLKKNYSLCVREEKQKRGLYLCKVCKSKMKLKAAEGTDALHSTAPLVLKIVSTVFVSYAVLLALTYITFIGLIFLLSRKTQDKPSVVTITKQTL